MNSNKKKNVKNFIKNRIYYGILKEKIERNKTFVSNIWIHVIFVWSTIIEFE